MKQKLTEDLKLQISLFDVEDEEDQEQFKVYWMLLNYDVKKKIQNAYYRALVNQAVERKYSMINHEHNGVAYIELDPREILDNINVIVNYIDLKEGE